MKDPKDPSRSVMMTGVPNGAEALWYVWYAESENTFKFAGRGCVQLARDVEFVGVGCASTFS
jgi:hypothetical protein